MYARSSGVPSSSIRKASGLPAFGGRIRWRFLAVRFATAPLRTCDRDDELGIWLSDLTVSLSGESEEAGRVSGCGRGAVERLRHAALHPSQAAQASPAAPLLRPTKNSVASTTLLRRVTGDVECNFDKARRNFDLRTESFRTVP